MAYGHDLADDEKRELLRIARATLREYGFSGRIPPGKPHRESLLAPAAVFVSLHQGDELRGCIGMTEEDRPLYRAIQEMAVAAATRDPRFPAMQAEELDDMTIEISVLGPPRRIKGPDDLRIGVDGLRVELGDQRGLLLPQVAPEAGWDAATFLAKTCRKAGLAEDAWRDPDAVIWAFGAQVFSDVTHPPAVRRPPTR
ncbi:MAG: AmmeMemoRadiSam system protein A [Kofleriaceae bacterium]|nr:AmmeMemoRadiSam system protein A [Myxococcales bacterium]MCB9571960.1 AmmeMemoRadiSam system protein A [Kofleriaceae bacterium]